MYEYNTLTSSFVNTGFPTKADCTICANTRMDIAIVKSTCEFQHSYHIPCLKSYVNESTAESRMIAICPDCNTDITYLKEPLNYLNYYTPIQGNCISEESFFRGMVFLKLWINDPDKPEKLIDQAVELLRSVHNNDDKINFKTAPLLIASRHKGELLINKTLSHSDPDPAWIEEAINCLVHPTLGHAPTKQSLPLLCKARLIKGAFSLEKASSATDRNNTLYQLNVATTELEYAVQYDRNDESIQLYHDALLRRGSYCLHMAQEPNSKPNDIGQALADLNNLYWREDYYHAGTLLLEAKKVAGEIYLGKAESDRYFLPLAIKYLQEVQDSKYYDVSGLLRWATHLASFRPKT